VKCPDIKKACPGNKAITITTKFANNAAQFKAQQKQFIAGVANAASVSPQQVVITQIKYLYKMSDKEKEQITDPAPMTPEEKAAEEAEAKAEAAAKAAAAAAAKGPATLPGDIPEGEWHPTCECTLSASTAGLDCGHCLCVCLWTIPPVYSTCVCCLHVRPAHAMVLKPQVQANNAI
jgi:hypothetical protein